MLVQGYPNIFI